MFDRYNVEVRVLRDSKAHIICSTYFKTIDQVIRFVDRFDLCECNIDIFDELIPDREISVTTLLNMWRSKDEN